MNALYSLIWIDCHLDDVNKTAGIRDNYAQKKKNKKKMAPIQDRWINSLN